jgi:hypothetical protein
MITVQAIHTCTCHGRICDHCETRVAVLQLITPRENFHPYIHETLCQTCATAFAGKVIQYAKTKPRYTAAEIRERQGLRR